MQWQDLCGKRETYHVVNAGEAVILHTKRYTIEGDSVLDGRVRHSDLNIFNEQMED